MGKRRKKRLLRFSPYIVAIGLGVGYIVKSLGGEILEQYHYSTLKDEVVNELPTEETTEEESVVVIPEEETQPESTEEEVEEPKVEVISDELLTLGYEFKDIDFEELKAKNEDVCGYIILDGTNISYPIVNATDEENSYYAHHDLDGNESKSGTIYVDTRCNSLENPTYDLSDVTLVYGHHMKHGLMFANLCEYMKEDYIDNHQFAIIYTPDGYAYKLTFFAGMRFSGESDEPIYRENLDDEQTFNEYIESLKENSSFTSDTEVNYGDKIIGLVTCEYTAGPDSRYGLFATVEKQYIDKLQIENSIDNSENISSALK